MSPRKKPAIERVARTAYIPKPLHEQLVKVAEETGVSANDIIILALRKFMGGDTTPLPAATPVSPPDDDMATFE